MLRRVIAASALTLAAVIGGGGHAFADPTPSPTPSTTAPAVPAQPGGDNFFDRSETWFEQNILGGVAGGACVNPPIPSMPDDGIAGWIDPGPDTPTPGTTYGGYGYGGWDTVLYDPGCLIKGADDITKLAGRQANNFNDITSILNQLTIIGAALLVLATRLVLGSATLWGLLDPLWQMLGATMGVRVMLIFGGVALGAIGLTFLAQARKGDVGYVVDASVKAATILMAGVFAASWVAGSGMLMQSVVAPVYSALSSTATSGQDAVTADAATGDAVIDNIMLPTWCYEHMGNNPDAVAEFCPRLHAAAAYTRGEAAYIRANPDALGSFYRAKQDDFNKVASELKSKYPNAYWQLTGRDPFQRPLWSLIGPVGLVTVAIPLAYALAWIGMFVFLSNGLVAVFPGLSLVVSQPRFQPIASRIVGAVLAVGATAFVLTIVYIAYMVAGVGGILSSGASLPVRLITLAALTWGMSAAWRNRGRLLEKTGAAGYIADLQRVAVAVARDIDRRTGRRDGSSDGTAGFHDRHRPGRHPDDEGPIDIGDVDLETVPPEPLDRDALEANEVRYQALERADARRRRGTTVARRTAPRQSGPSDDASTDVILGEVVDTNEGSDAR